MPSLNITSIGQNGCQWYISGLSSDWNTANYVDAYITISPVGSSSPVYPPASGTSRSTGWGSFSGLSPNTTYTAYAYVQTPNGQTYSAGSAMFTTQGPPRPSNWDWWTTKSSGVNFNITPSEWASFTDRINSFRQYKSLSSYSFTTSFSSGNGFPAYIFNQAVYAISAMNPPVSTPSTVSTNDWVYASYFNSLRNSLNSI